MTVRTERGKEEVRREARGAGADHCLSRNYSQTISAQMLGLAKEPVTQIPNAWSFKSISNQQYKTNQVKQSIIKSANWFANWNSAVSRQLSPLSFATGHSEDTMAVICLSFRCKIHILELRHTRGPSVSSIASYVSIYRCCPDVLKTPLVWPGLDTGAPIPPSPPPLTIRPLPDRKLGSCTDCTPLRIIFSGSGFIFQTFICSKQQASSKQA